MWWQDAPRDQPLYKDRANGTDGVVVSLDPGPDGTPPPPPVLSGHAASLAPY